MILKILLAGDGGQGIQTIAEIICRAAFQKNWHVSYIPNYGLEQRGGVSLSFIQISDKVIGYSKFTTPDILLIMSEQARARVKNYESGIMNYDVKDYAQKLEEQKIGKSSYNIFFLGLLVKYLEEKNVLKKEEVYELLEKKLGKKLNWEENKSIFQTCTL
ncbi:MAG: 2-oxoacid:acceptor oxidoreductase, gamma subunit, pyruvate/2-ketoisovalerate [Candidatus Magasanikbacteria bacterium GW2011_GWC2_34_16]|uniref:2-oxoacid:acceptor oxidoreductase, gamma subunit, pyruvate/2-ketoisovalerate n=2 Tax=Candidatus Magasanikiibacteriota TaxID=1752731 RepID=A0A0G0HE70_9BACT|nr:MAG: 2-oxoacid:acceptor oxidoreductase, gamma subunit, pyruvate/2-ketoisovalerate [Candidatus Magasanikbacteria bacterium GW2011_GWC2_34_16]KKQ40497.1 MAG: 2-oxoacid:acceptor oxidoreductase, gamma subunit, pyruvate/2-ketoisovalerate [Candidatus Magasanikbacteria bacterium GW2011_GWA2_37_8]